MLDVMRVRKDFPILDTEVHGHPLVYLDNAATTQKPQCVLDSIVRFYTTYNSNIHRGVHYLSEKATEIYEQARQKVMQAAQSERAPDVLRWAAAKEQQDDAAQLHSVHIDSCESKLESIRVLYEAGILDREEYAQRKARILAKHNAV